MTLKCRFGITTKANPGWNPSLIPGGATPNYFPSEKNLNEPENDEKFETRTKSIQ